MKKIILGLAALAALTAACHEQRQDPPPDYGAVRAHANDSQGSMQKEQNSQPSAQGQ